MATGVIDNALDCHSSAPAKPNKIRKISGVVILGREREVLRLRPGAAAPLISTPR